jgi:hypothetical protein
MLLFVGGGAAAGAGLALLLLSGALPPDAVAVAFLTVAIASAGALWSRYGAALRRDGLAATARRALAEAAGGGGGGARAAAAPPRPPRRSRAQMAAVVHRLPLEEFRTRAELAALPVVALRAQLAARGGGGAAAAASAFREKGELVAAAAAAGGGGNSAAESCAICCEEYASGDVLRALRCALRFHCECVDRWLLIEATNFSRPVACPLCNAPVEPAA